MPLTSEQNKLLENSIHDYNYPCALYDFIQEKAIYFRNMRELENSLRSNLFSSDMEKVKFSLANVVFWGFASTPLADVRSKRFLKKVTKGQLYEAINLFPSLNENSLKELKALGLPQFSQMSFCSKLRMFLDPKNYVVLDSQLLKIKNSGINTFFSEIQRYRTSIPINKTNCNQYEKWCHLCRETSRGFSNKDFVAVDIERGVFQLIIKGNISVAASIVRSMQNSFGERL